MLLLLAEYLQQFYKGFGVFQYLTLRAFSACSPRCRCRCGWGPG